MSPIFPSISYPDWTTLITGLWPESHGVVGNYFYDTIQKDNFSLFDADSTGKHKVCFKDIQVEEVKILFVYSGGKMRNPFGLEVQRLKFIRQ